jgi:hypothetical protein
LTMADKRDSANGSGILFRMVQTITWVHRLWTLFLKSVAFSRNGCPIRLISTRSNVSGERSKRRLNWGEISTREEAIQIIKRVWSEFEQASIDSLVGSFANQVTMLKDAQGRTIQSLISAGRTIIPPGYASVMRTPITWDDGADQLVIELVRRYGRR